MMLTSRTEMDAIGALSPRAVVGYLESKGWRRRSAYGEYGAILGRSIDGRDEELLISTSPEAGDFARVMSLFVSDLAEAEGRSPYDVIADLTLAPYDVIRVRSSEADDIGSVSLSAGVELHEQARAVVAAAANTAAAARPRAYWQGRPFEKVEAYLNALRLGQSQRGSFVLSLLSPWDFAPAEGSQTSLLDEVPFGRQVTRALSRALIATRRALTEAVSADISAVFSKAVADGVSINLCEALAILAREGDGVDVSVNWSLTKPDGEGTLLRLRREDAQTLVEARQVLVKAEPLPDATVEGVILQITNDLNSFDGSVVILAPINGTVRKVQAKFQERDRVIVFDAGQQKLGIRVVGELASHGRRLELQNPRDLTVITPTDDEDALS